MMTLTTKKFTWWPSVVVFIRLLTLFIQMHNAQSFHKRESDGNEIYEIRIFETAPPGTKATLNEAFDRLMREQKNCFAQLETASDVDWIEFDSALLMFLTTTEVPSTAKTTQQAILHLMCSSNKMRSIHFSIHVTRRNRHPPIFSADSFEFYAPSNLEVGKEIGRLKILDNDPIIYNSQIQLNILPNLVTNGRSGMPSFRSQITTNADDFESHWEIRKNGSLFVQKSMSDLQLYRPYTIRILAVDFGSPQLFSICNVTIIPVSVSQPRNVRVNVANTEYQIFEWESPSYGIPEKYHLTIRRNNAVLYTQDIASNENIALSRMRFSSAPDYFVTITAVDVDGESPAEPHNFMLIKSELECNGICAPNGGVPLCYYGQFHKIEQYRDENGAHCLCYDGYSSPQCDIIESCPGEILLESYGGVDWPFTPVNQSASIPCPYNSNDETITRRCVWDSRFNMARWENVSDNDACKKQSSILVHLGVLANYAQRADQTVSGLRAVQRFLSTILRMPAFRPEIPEAHFDSKIAEHVAQVIDTIASMNLTVITANTTDVNEALVDYIINFAQRIPVPFHLQSSEGGFQVKTWHWLNTAAQMTLPVDDSKRGDIGDEFPTLFGRRCYVHLPSRRRQKLGASGQLIAHNSLGSISQIIRIVCLRSSTVLPLLDGRSPVLFASIDVNETNSDKLDVNSTRSTTSREKDDNNGFPHIENLGQVSHNQLLKKQKIAGDSKALIALRPEPLYGGVQVNRNNINYTCAIYDHIKRSWSINEITVLSRNFEDGFILCETTHLGIFALLPESIFDRKRIFPLKVLVTVLPIASASFAILCTMFLLLIAILQRPRCTDPALVAFLLTFLFLHAIHLIVLIAPHLYSSAFSFERDCLINLMIQYCLIGFAALLTLLNASTHARIVDLELGMRRVVSLCCRLISTFVVGIGLPLSFCTITWLFNGYIYYGITTSTPTLQSFNYVFGLTFILPLVIFIGCAMGYAGYSYYYSNALANLTSPYSTHHSTLLLSGNTSTSTTTTTTESGKHSLLRDLANSEMFSILTLIIFYANSVVFYQENSEKKNLLLAVFHLILSATVFIFTGLNYRIELKFPRYTRRNHIGEASQNILGNGGNGNGNGFNILHSKTKANGNGNCHAASDFVLSNDEIDSNIIKSRLLAAISEKSDKNHTKNGVIHIEKIHVPSGATSKQVGEANNETNETSNRSSVKISGKIGSKDEDADSGRLTLNSPPLSSLSTTAAQNHQLNNGTEIETTNSSSRSLVGCNSSLNNNTSPLSNFGTGSTLSNVNASSRHSSFLLRHDEINIVPITTSYNNGCRSEFASIRRGSQPTINTLFRGNTGCYDHMLPSVPTGPVMVLSPRLPKHSESNIESETLPADAGGQPIIYRTTAVREERQQQMQQQHNHAPLKLNLIYGNRIGKVDPPLTNSSLLMSTNISMDDNNNNKFSREILSAYGALPSEDNMSDDLPISLSFASSASTVTDPQQRVSMIVKKILLNSNNNDSHILNASIVSERNGIRKARFDEDDDNDQDSVNDVPMVGESENENIIDDNNELLHHPIVSVV